MSRSWLGALGALILFPAAAAAGDLRQDALAAIQPIEPAQVAKAVKGDEVTAAKVDLGRKLFFDPRLSRSQLIACASCHNLSTGGVDAGPTSVGHGWQKGPRRAPSVLNAVFNVAQFWDGRAEDLKAQAKGPVQAGVEMNNTPATVEITLRSIPGYVGDFKNAFPNDASPVSFDNMAKAIAAFESTLITPNARVDKFLKGDDAALNEQEKKGLRLFLDKGCAGCHNGVNIGGANGAGAGPDGASGAIGAEIGSDGTSGAGSGPHGTNGTDPRARGAGRAADPGGPDAAETDRRARRLLAGLAAYAAVSLVFTVMVFKVPGMLGTGLFAPRYTIWFAIGMALAVVSVWAHAGSATAGRLCRTVAAIKPKKPADHTPAAIRIPSKQRITGAQKRGRLSK